MKDSWQNYARKLRTGGSSPEREAINKADKGKNGKGEGESAKTEEGEVLVWKAKENEVAEGKSPLGGPRRKDANIQSGGNKGVEPTNSWFEGKMFPHGRRGKSRKGEERREEKDKRSIA